MRPAPTTPFTDPDYRDHFTLRPGRPFASLDDFVSRLVLDQPSWLTKLSMGIGATDRRRAALVDLAAGRTDRIGNWAVVERGPATITFGEDMGIMRYRLRYELLDDGTVTAATEVEQTTHWFGPIYWTLATPLHRRFLPRLLRNAGGAGSQTFETEHTSIVPDHASPDR